MKEDQREEWKAIVNTVRAEALEVARSTRPMSDGDKEEVRDVLRRLYVCRGETPPDKKRMVFVSSPFVAMVAAGAAALTYKTVPPKRLSMRNRGGINLSAVVEKKSGYSLTRISGFDKAVSSIVRASAGLNPLIEIPVRMASEVLGDVLGEEDLIGKILARLKTEELRAGVAEAIRACSGKQSRNLDSAFLVQGVDVVGWVTDSLEGGNLHAEILTLGMLAHRSDRDVKLTDELRLCARIAELAGPWVAHPEFCVVSDRPRLLEVDAGGLLHSPSQGPACRWSDGTRLYFLHGVRVDSKCVDESDKMTADHLEKMKLAQRQVCIDRAPKREQVIHSIRELSDEDDS